MAEKIKWLYTIIQLLIVFISMVYGVLYWQKIKQNGYLKLFPFYIVVSMLLTLASLFKNINSLSLLVQNIFIPFEFFIFYNFFIKVLQNKKVYPILIILSVLFVLSVIIVPAYYYTNQNKYKNVILFLSHRGFSEIFVIENIFIVIPILLYYTSLFNRPYIKNLSADSIFFAMTGILFCFTISTPLFVFYKIIWSQSRQIYTFLFPINCLAYIIMHIFFIKAFKSIK